MPTFRCTACGRRVESPVVIGAGDCPRCGGDVVFDLRGEPVEQTDRPRPVEQTARPRPVEQPDRPPREGRARALLRRLLGR